MKAVVFGGAGFLGSHVADELTRRGHNVCIFDLYASPYAQENQLSITGDITDVKSVNEVMTNAEIVYNFAGIADMERAKKTPLDTITNNVLGNAIILDAACKANVKRFVFASTLYVYSRAGSFYRSSKQASELFIENYHDIYDLNYTVLRYGSLYGPRSDDSNWIKFILKQALTENKIVRYGDGDEIREYIHVYDAARLSVDILDDQYSNQHVIISGNQPLRIKDLMIMIREILNNKIDLEFAPANSSEHYEITPYSFNPKLAMKIQNSHYVDLGQGIMNLLSELNLNQSKT